MKAFIKTEFFDNKVGLFIGLNKNKIKKSQDIEVPFKKLNFIKLGKIYTICALVLLIVCSIVTYFTKFNLGVDFTGGTSIVINDKIDLQEDLKEFNYTLKDSTMTDKDSTYIIDEVLEKDSIKKLNDHIFNKYNVSSDIYVVSDVVKKDLVKNALYSLLLSSVAIVIYVSFRFKFNYAISGLIALAHDIVFTLLFFGIFKIEINSVFIAAILTIIGYSINDTIVTFDMIRETYNNKKEIKSKEDLDEIVDTSIKRVFFRSILTTITTLVPVICLIIMGAKEIQGFNIALLVGFIFGVLSSIFISNYLWRALEYRKLTKPKKEYEDDEPNEYKVKGINC